MQLAEAGFLDASTREDGRSTVVRVDALRGFPEMVRDYGGDPDALLTRAQIRPDLLANRQAVISYRSLVHLLERCATELACPDFGLRLAERQGGAKVLGPLEVVMRNSSSLGDAFRYCAEHVQAYSPATRIRLEPEVGGERTFLKFEIALAHLPNQRQAVEQALLLTQHAAKSIGGEEARAREIWFAHEQALPMAVYRGHFQAIVRFGQPKNGMVFREADLRRPIPDPDPQLYEIATCFIDTRFPSAAMTMSSRVRSAIAPMLADGPCTNSRVASALGLHPRSLQRRLREEGESFEAIKDAVRRDVALRYLRQPDVPLMRVAEMLGYSEASVLSRSCFRWFAASPRQLRSRFTQEFLAAGM